VDALPTLPPTPTHPYTGADQTAGARAALQKALDHYKPGQIALPPVGADLSRSDTRSFGESHASELNSAHPGLSITPPPTQQSEKSNHSPPPINPTTLNQSPAPIPVRPSAITGLPPALSRPMTDDSSNAAIPEPPTVAETGVPLSAGPSGPGPARGSLKDAQSGSQDLGTQSVDQVPKATVDDLYSNAQPRSETAEEEKKRLEREERERVLAASTTTQPKSESAEDEKRRLEREEQERVREGAASNEGQGEGGQRDGDELPPYKDVENI